MSAPQPKSDLASAPKIVTLGCRLNTLESQVMRDELVSAGINNAVVVNTCAVTLEAERQARQTIRRLRRENPDANIIVTGCAAQLDPERYGAMAEVDRVVGNAEKLSLETLLGNDRISVGDISALRETAGHLVAGLDGRTRAFVMVQQGCDNTCTFCIIPTARGHNRAVTIADITAQVKKLVGEGFKEVVLTGVDIAAYGDDLETEITLADVIKTVLAEVPKLQRLRLSSLDPARIDDQLIDLFKNEARLQPHIHLSLQAGDDMVLKRMKRRHRLADVAEVLARLKDARPDIAFGADLIAGFPTETEEMFANTLSSVRELGLTYLHVFPYSPRPKTPAAKMPQVDPAITKQRARVLRGEGERALEDHMKNLVGTAQSVLVEKQGFARTPCFAPVRIASRAEAGDIIKVQITQLIDGELHASPIDNGPATGQLNELV